MEPSPPDRFTGAWGFVLRVSLAVHVAGSLAYWLLQPRGFGVLSRPFVEHQVLAPVLFAVSVAALAGIVLKRPWPAGIGVGILAGFWILCSGVIAGVGTTAFSRPFWGLLAAVLAGLAVAYRQLRPASPALLTGGTILGLGLAALFWICSWAPPAGTRPRDSVMEPAAATPEGSALEKDGIRMSVSGRSIFLQSGGSEAVLWPGFDYDAVSDSGFWTIFQFRSTSLPFWKSGLAPDGTLLLTAENEDLIAVAKASIDNRTIHLRCTTMVKRDLAAHLSSVMQLQLRGPANCEGIPWQVGHEAPRSEFMAFRRGKLELLRAAGDEKGPFETLGSWAPQDPLLMIGGWKVQVRGWAEQGSLDESTTAGWGVSQAAIERVGSIYLWSIASTSIGRGWHTVRTKAGVYTLEAVLTPP